ncbi:hypothetical protein CEQ21_22595 [Niallia circulans]|uniref:Uncharacterized protein n=1 Tax=Niallia circulans TaxID=1397 RepID=A0A553SMI3_NIACI|nr:hypothetical protein [Niallia circulans]TRZ38196.1 hypothetical protein CEQ21_22595 [Niallia circulans]
MFFVVFICFAWLFAAIFYIQPKVISKAENMIIFLIMLVISIHWNWIIYEELILVEISKSTGNYLSFLIFRSIIVPLAAIMYINIIQTNTSKLKTIMVTFGGAFCLFAFILLALAGDIIEIKHWHLIFDYLYFVLYFCAVLAIHYFYVITIQKEGKMT